MSVPRIQPSAAYRQEDLSRIQENLARSIEKIDPTTAPIQHTLFAGAVNGGNLPVVTDVPQQLLYSSTLAWRNVPTYAGTVEKISAWLFIASGSAVTFNIYVNNKIIAAIPGSFNSGTMMADVPTPVPFNAKDIVEIRVRSATSSASTAVQLMAYMVLQESM